MRTLPNIIKENISTTGTSMLVSLTGAVNGFIAFSDTIQVTNDSLVYYQINDGADIEQGIGKYTSNSEFERTTVLYTLINGVGNSSPETRLNLSGNAVIICSAVLDLADTTSLPQAVITHILSIYGSLILEGLSDTGLKVDPIAPRFTWEDLRGRLHEDPTGANAPTVETFATGIERLGVNASDKLRYEFHLEHRERIGGNKYIHLHIAKAVGATAAGSDLLVNATIAFVYGHGHKDYVTGVTPASPPPISKAFTITNADFNKIGAGSEGIIEILLAEEGGSGSTFDSLNWLPDDRIIAIFTIAAIPTLTGGTSSKICIPDVDVHREVIVIGTANKDTSTGSFYVVNGS